jgi:hypothetical protein
MADNPYADLAEKNPYEGMTQPQSGPMPANAGLANFAASVAGLPMDTVQNFVNLTRAAQGGIAGLFGQTEWMPPLVNNIPGGSQNIREMLRSTGEPGLSPDNPTPDSRMGSAQFDFVSRGGVIPGGALPAAGSMVAEKVLGPEWAGVGALSPQAAITAYNAARAPGLARREQQNAVTDSTLAAARDEGYVVPPSSSGGGFLSRRLESIAGKAAVGQEAAARNQIVTNNIAKKELGVPENLPLTESTLKTLARNEAAPYREIARLSPVANKALERLQDTRAESKLAWQEFNRQGSRQAYKDAKKFDADAQVLEGVIEREATRAGSPELLSELRAARTAIAKIHDVDRALNIGTGDVSAKMLGKALDKGKPLTGGLATAGRFAEGFPSYAREGATIPTPGVSKSEAIFSTMLALGGYGALGPGGIALAALPLASGPTRSLLLSGPYQNAAMPSYTPAMKPAPSPQLLYQLGILQQPQN